MFADSQAPIGTVLCGRYRILELIGDGGMGRVYAAEHIELRRKVAIKILKPDLSKVEAYVERFLQEARAASMIHQPNVVDILDFGRASGGPVFFAMEFLEGEDLATLLRRQRRLPWPRVQRIAFQVARGLHAAHQCGVVHRDLKPANLYLIHRGHESDFVKILDFGIAKVPAPAGRGALTGEGSVFGTAAYMSPEQAAGLPVDGRSDVYSLGVLMYEMLTGRLPFEGDNFLRVATQHINDPIPLPGDVAPDAGISEAIQDLVMRALAKRPADRYPSMAEFEVAMMAASFDATVAVANPLLPPPRDQTSIYYAGQPEAAQVAGPLEVDLVDATVVRPRAASRPVAAATFARPNFATAPPMVLGGYQPAGPSASPLRAGADDFGGAMPAGFDHVAADPVAHRTLPPVSWQGHNPATGDSPGRDGRDTDEFALNLPRREVSRNWLVIAVSAVVITLLAVGGATWFLLFTDADPAQAEVHPIVVADEPRQTLPAIAPAKVELPPPQADRVPAEVIAQPEPAPAPEQVASPRSAPKPKSVAPRPDPVTTLSNKEIDRGFGRARADVVACGKKHGALEGAHFAVTFDVADGRASNVAVQRPHNITSLGRCVAAAIENKARFGKARSPSRGLTRRVRF